MQYFIYLTRVDHKTFVPLQTHRESHEQDGDFCKLRRLQRFSYIVIIIKSLQQLFFQILGSVLHQDALKLPKFRISASSLTDVVPPQWRTSIHCANAYSALASGKPLCTGVTYNDELLPQIKQCARCLSRDRLFAMCDVNNDLIFFCN